MCQEGRFSLSYPAPGNLNPRQGSLSLWVAAVQWRHGDGKNHNFMTLRGEPKYLLYTYISQPTYFLQLEGANPHVGAEVDWQPGVWHHLVATWQEGDFRLYVDGKLAGLDSETMSLARQPGELFDVGSHNFGCEDATAFDELVIFRRALAAEEVAALHAWAAQPTAAGPVPRVAEVPPLQGSLRHLTMAGRVEVTLYPTGAGLAEGQGLAVTARLVEAAGKALRTQTIIAPQGKRTVVSFEVAGLAGGQYAVSLEAPGGKPLVLAFERRARPEWLGNRLGLEGGVPAPWTAVGVRAKEGGRTISVWGREYRFGKGLLEQATTQGAGLLAGPVALKLTQAAGVAACEMGPAAVAARTPEAVTLTAAGRLGPLALQTKATCEYDGFNWFEVTLTPPAEGVAVEGLTLELPFAQERATLLYSGHYYPALDNGTGGITAEGFTGDWRPWFWVGDETGGLQWCAEHHRGWVLSKAKEALRVAPEGDDRGPAECD